MSLTRLITASIVALAGQAVAAEVDISTCPAQKSVSVSVHDAAIVKLKNGEAAAIRLAPVKIEEANYHWRYRATPTAQIKTGTGRVFEDYARTTKPNGERIVTRMNTERDLHILAGNIAVRWSAKDKTSGWLYYCTELASVQLVPLKEFESKP